MLTAILDTNLWISFLIGKQLSELKLLISEGVIIPVYSQELLQEFLQVTQRQKFKKYFKSQAISELIVFLNEIGKMVEITSMVSICRDPKDNYLLALAKDGNVDFLITGDKDLLILKRFEKTIILSYNEFLMTVNS
jgi:uncharacterized protein